MSINVRILINVEEDNAAAAPEVASRIARETAKNKFNRSPVNIVEPSE